MGVRRYDRAPDGRSWIAERQKAYCRLFIEQLGDRADDPIVSGVIPKMRLPAADTGQH